MAFATAHRRAAEIVARNREIAAVIYGETGTGKEEIAKLIHRRRVALEGPVPFISVNCANLNSELADSILFGHVKGAFSGADRNTVGLVGEADGGILFLDEIHTLSLKTQYKLLRVMNDGSYSRLGSSVVQRSRFQALVASTRDLDEAVDRGEFLLDFRSRLIGIDFHLPPLRERQDEMELLVALFFARQQIELAPSEFAAIVARCRRYYWRGNIRQLYKVLQAMVITAQCNDVPIRAADMPEFKTMLAPAGEERAPEPVAASAPMAAPVVQAAKDAHEPEGLALLRRALREDVSLDVVLDAVEKTVIEASIQRHRLLQDSYRALGIGRNTFDVKRKKHGIVVDR
jgi:transcriptional regulator with AAA-type ATPase domain